MYFTISNMRGIPFRVEFGRSSYGMQTIGDRVHYVAEWDCSGLMTSQAMQVRAHPSCGHY
jgi:hypothetical protein